MLLPFFVAPLLGLEHFHLFPNQFLLVPVLQIYNKYQVEIVGMEKN